MREGRGDQRLRPAERLRQSRDFQRVFEHGKKVVTPAFVVYLLPGQAPCSRLGTAVSKRVGKAVVRNRVKRLVREFFRCHKALLTPPCDIVFVARSAAACIRYEDLVQQCSEPLQYRQQRESVKDV